MTLEWDERVSRRVARSSWMGSESGDMGLDWLGLG
jgi:hypothetical protein